MLGVGRGAPVSDAEMQSIVRDKIRSQAHVLKAAFQFGNAGLLDRHGRRQQDEATLLLDNLDRHQQDEATLPSTQVPATHDEATTLRSTQLSGGTDHLEQQQKRYSNYSLMTLLFMVTMFAEYLLSASASFSVTKMLFTIALAALFFIDAAFFKITAVKWGTALVCLSWFLLVLLLYILLLSFHKDYCYAILPVPLPIVAALLQHKLQLGGGQQSTDDVENRELDNMEAGLQGTSNTNEADEDARTHDEEDKLFNHIFKLSFGIVNCGSLISMVLGHYMVGQVNAAGHFFFFTVVLGLYLMMITTVRTAILTRHAKYLTILLKGLLVITVITAVIHGVNK